MGRFYKLILSKISLKFLPPDVPAIFSKFLGAEGAFLQDFPDSQPFLFTPVPFFGG
ncbi:hypothetical protein Thini_0017 [Thiothrix nivea DSM 5205]|uniref:Uncharacterized protein n=1 Tax=Thiothrix nivea (strain ATCC 35100 / DSM 5205 / JP2) TaxID=870187 RepID=A0A656HLB3_THINJ|nr:hypothetical protein Thini_0017 [Thiothrix nivea DSM 5205]